MKDEPPEEGNQAGRPSLFRGRDNHLDDRDRLRIVHDSDQLVSTGQAIQNKLEDNPYAKGRAVKTIYKYSLRITDRQILTIPKGSSYLKVLPNPLADVLDIWFIVEPDNDIEMRTFQIVGTGNPMPTDRVVHLDTVSIHNGVLILHVFEVEMD